MINFIYVKKNWHVKISESKMKGEESNEKNKEK